MRTRHRTLLGGLVRYVHGGQDLPTAAVSCYGTGSREDDGSGRPWGRPGAQAALQGWQKRFLPGDGPLGKRLDDVVEEFARELAKVTAGLLRTPGWSGVQRIAVGGGLRGSCMGKLAIARTSALLRAGGHAVSLQPIHCHPDESGLIGSVRLVPAACLVGHDAVLAVDIGGSSVRAGLVELNLDDNPDLGAVRVVGPCIWHHAREAPGRDEVVTRLVAMLTDLIRRARRERYRLAPLVGLACPGVIGADGRIEYGGQNLPGDWRADGFNLPLRLAELLPEIDGQKVSVVMHNEAVLQGLSEQPWMAGTARWGALTIGAGLEHASFHNRASR